MSNKEIVYIFDLDGTITAKETLPIISHHFNVGHKIDELTEETVKGNIPFVESFIKRVNILGKLPVDEINEILSKVPLLEQVVSFIQEHPGQCVIATGNLSGWVESLCKRIGCEYFCSDGLIQNNQIKKLTHILKKEDVVHHFKSQNKTVVFIGDGNNDVTAMQISDIAVACGIVHQPAKGTLNAADYVVYDETALVRLLSQINNEMEGKSVVVSCAGIGSRLGLNLTKALINIEGKPLIHHQLENFENVEDVRIVVGFQAKEVIQAVLEKRKDVIFAYNHDYFHTKTGASFYLGARHGKKFVVAWDGDLLVHPKDVEKCLSFDGEFVGCSDVVSDEPVFVKLSADNQVVSFSRENGDYEWVGPACLERSKVKFVSNNVFNQFENHLPIPMLKTDARDVDTYDDYIRAKAFVKSWSDE
ncbi:MAG: HAD-IB family phosphatase [Paracoccaceae bacterium]